MDSALSRRTLALWTAAAVAASVLLVALPAGARAVAWNEVTAASEAADQAEAALGAAERELEEARVERDRLTDLLGRLVEREAELDRDSAVRSAQVRDAVARLYMVAGAESSRLLHADVASFAARSAYFGAIVDHDQAEVVDLAFTAADVAALRSEVIEALDHWDGEIALRTANLEARRAAHVEALARYDDLYDQWLIEEAARQAELRRKEEELARQLTSTTSTRPVGPTTSTTMIDYPWNPGAGVEQWRSMVTEVFSNWGLDRPDCETRDGTEFCVGDQIGHALTVMACESGGNPMARNPSSGTSGLFQNHPYYWQSRVDRVRAYHRDKAPDFPADASIFNPEHNTVVAALLVWESKETLLGRRGGGGWSPAVWPEFNFDRFEESGVGYSVWGLGPEPWGHWSCGVRRGIWTGSWIHPWAEQQEQP